MKKLFVFLLVLCLISGLVSCGGQSDDKIKAVRNVSFKNTELTVTLGTNKSTGYKWDYKIYGECIEPSINSTFKITGSKGDAIGEITIGFEGKFEGTAAIVFTTPNGWDGTGEGDGYTVNVEVDTDGKIISASGSEGAIIPKTSVAIAEIAEGTYTGTLSGVEIISENEDTVAVTIHTTLSPADIAVTIENGQITLYSEATASSYAMIQDVKTPQTPEYHMILSGSLPLQQNGEAVIAEGTVPALGDSASVHYTDGVFDRWEIKERGEGATYSCTVHIAMKNGVPVAEITSGVRSVRTATVPLALATGTKDSDNETPLSAPYAEMLRSGDYQYTYALDYEGKPYTATIATYNGMICRKIVSDDGTFSQRVVTIDGKAWKVDDLSGAVVDGGAENAETIPDYASTLTFIASKALETGAIADAYDFEFAGQKANMVFIFVEEKLVALIVTVGGETSEMEIRSFSSVGNERSLFDAPQ